MQSHFKRDGGPFATPSPIGCRTMLMPQPKEIFPGTEGLPQVYLKPGELVVAWNPTLITTLLGSCISIIISVPHNRVTAVSHCTLPHYGRSGGDSIFAFVDTATEYMIDTLKIKNVSSSRVLVKVFGGGDVVSRKEPMALGRKTVGKMNIEATREALARHGLTAEVCKVGGKRGYKLFVRSDTGQVRMRYLTHAVNGGVIKI